MKKIVTAGYLTSHRKWQLERCVCAMFQTQEEQLDDFVLQSRQYASM